MIWWVVQPERLKAERDALAALVESSDWLTLGQWWLEAQLRTAIAFDISVGGKTFPLKLVYSSYFPDTPPSVFTTDGQQISGHQYGPDGELCLEWRADN